jgi:phosphate transport system permease protein
MNAEIAASNARVEARTAEGAVRTRSTSLSAQGEPFLWIMGGALALGVIMIVGFLLLVLWNGAVTFWPKPVAVVTLTDGKLIAGEPTRSELFRPSAEVLKDASAAAKAAIARDDGYAGRTLYRTGNYDVYNEDFRWAASFETDKVEYPANMIFAERLEWGPLVGALKAVKIAGVETPASDPREPRLAAAHEKARERWSRIRRIEKVEIGEINHHLNAERLALRKAQLRYEPGSAEVQAAEERLRTLQPARQKRYDELAAEARALREEDAGDQVVFLTVEGTEKAVPLSAVVRMYPANALGLGEKIGLYLSRWWEFLSEEPREANTEGGVLPAIFGTAAMTLLMVLAVAPFGVVTALYLREYARQGRLVAIVRISVNNLAGVPSIVYGVFGLGFFAYIVGASIDQLFYAERLPNPTFGTGGLLWASLTLALLTVPVVIVATEEALAAVPRSMREGSLACGASKWQTIRYIVLPRAMPGIMTGLILAMARGAGEVAPLMLVGVVKLAPELPVDGFFPFIHLERSFMHLGFHIFDVGFQSRNSEAGKPMVFVTTMLLIFLIALMNIWAIVVRNRLKRRFSTGQF